MPLKKAIYYLVTALSLLLPLVELYYWVMYSLAFVLPFYLLGGIFFLFRGFGNIKKVYLTTLAIHVMIFIILAFLCKVFGICGNPIRPTSLIHHR